MLVSEDLQERVNKGAEWLDIVKPDWHRLIDMHMFDLHCVDYCILGQLYRNDVVPGIHDSGFYVGHYRLIDYYTALGVDTEDVVYAHGFISNFELMDDMHRLWVELIRSRLPGSV